ncbi:MAG: hypothetical protein IPM55_21720 [Acidobacteria bacterium]|nr:hypothetical protein [Acidobacteriota bacterium]
MAAAYPGWNRWDYQFFGGTLVYGIAVDDAHHFKRPWTRRRAARPGRGWPWWKAEQLIAPAIICMDRGDLCPSTGVAGRLLRRWKHYYRSKIKEDQLSKYRVQFIGRGENLPSAGGS